jgi:hypothetical protein
MNRTEFMEMHANCVDALGTYFVEAQKSAEMLAECGVDPLSFSKRFKLMSQGIVENDAHVSYLGQKSLLYKAALLGYGFSN